MVVDTFDGDRGVFAVEEGFHLVGPFDEAVAAAVEVVLESDAGSVIGVFDAVEVEMVKRLSVAGPVFIDLNRSNIYGRHNACIGKEP